MGGSNGHSDELSCGETYDPHADEWAQVPELRTNRCNAGKENIWPMGECVNCRLAGCGRCELSVNGFSLSAQVSVP